MQYCSFEILTLCSVHSDVCLVVKTSPVRCSCCPSKLVRLTHVNSCGSFPNAGCRLIMKVPDSEILSL